MNTNHALFFFLACFMSSQAAFSQQDKITLQSENKLPQSLKLASKSVQYIILLQHIKFTVLLKFLGFFSIILYLLPLVSYIVYFVTNVALLLQQSYLSV